MSTPADPRDPRFRAFRGAALGVYLLFTVTFCVFIIVSVYRSVLGMTPDEQPPAGEVLSEEQCFTQLRGLFTELEGARKELGEQALVVKADSRFLQFRVEWLRKKRVLEAQCGLQSREKARAAFAS
ncbi:MAG TPA: hypothetical protein VGD87_12435, partial [Archangium sp.]